ncbi:hypothetical protein ACV3KT_09615 [Clostridium perfringens]
MFQFIIIGAVGILFSVLGYLVMVKKKTSLIHHYHLRGGTLKIIAALWEDFYSF